MYEGYLHLHNTLRWLLLISLLVTLVKFMAGWLLAQPWKKLDKLISLTTLLLIDLQIITGLSLYIFLSPITKIAFTNFGNAMKDASLRFYAVEHISLMVIAAVLFHIGYAKSKRGKTDSDKFRIASIFYLIALVIIFVAIPWGRA
jgi:cytochrome c biogenesis factor